MTALFFTVSSCRGATETLQVRESILAGGWYLKNPDKLRNRLNLYLDRVGTVHLKEKPVAIISPHAGYIYSAQAAAYGFKTLQGQDINRVVILALSHRVPYAGASIPGDDAYETPLGRVPLDRKACDQLLQSPLFQTIPQVHQMEHSIEIQIPFLQVVLKEGFHIVPIVFSSMKPEDYKTAADEIRKIVDAKTALIASSDFVHYGKRFDYVPSQKNVPPTIKKIDFGAIEDILNLNATGFLQHCEKTGATICGRAGIGVLLHFLPKNTRGTLLRYYRSGDITGDWEGSVSYASILFTEKNSSLQDAEAVSITGSEKERRQAEMLIEEEQKELLRLARKTLESYVKEKKVPDTTAMAKTLSKGLNKELGVFVTLREHGQLRGCIGHIVGREPLFKGVVDNAVNACSRDHRFTPVQPKELKDIDIEISVLGPLKEVDHYDKIIPGWHGVVLQKHGLQSVYLPQVPLEIGWELDEMLSNLAVKAGLGRNDWKSGATFHTFEAQIFTEEK